ncbi:MAG: EAL domain-containing protein, partial [Thiotrichales bacterium]|nr:EAL domain-containing protein [Thiotrichales bacterium]
MSDSLLCEETRARLADTSLGRELLAIFQHENITTLFQPIVNLKKRSIYAFECLTRGPENTPLYSPINLFGLADDMGCLLQMDVLARNVAIRNFVSASSFHQNQAKLFINVTVSSLLDKNHRSGRTLQLLAQSQLDLSQVVIEITELQPIEDCDIFLKALNHYRSMGFKVAIDDLGSGYNGLKLWSAVKPDYVKIDKHFISNIDSQADKYRFMETIVILAKGLGTKIIAEGVETEQELYILEKLGVDLVQGFLLKRPSALPALSLS